MKWLSSLVGMAILALASTAMAADVELSFYYPVAVGGPITKTIDGYAADFEKENPGIKIKAIYAGTYQDTLVKALTAFKSGEPPDVAVLLSTDMFTLIDEDAVMPFDPLLQSDADKAWAKSFYPAFMENSQTGGKTWGIPFQRSTIVMYGTRMHLRPLALILIKRRTIGTNLLPTAKSSPNVTAAMFPSGALRSRRPDFPIGYSRV